MFSKFTFIVSIIVILFVHFTILSSFKIEEKRVVVTQQPSITKISVKKVVLKKKEVKKIEPKVEVKKIVKPKPIKKKVKKIVKKAKRKVFKKRVVKKIEKTPKRVVEKVKKIEKVVLKEVPKIVPSLPQKTVSLKPKKNVISPVQKDAIKNEYLAKLRAKIEKNKVYPKRAKRLRQQGKVIVSFIISKEGHINKVNLKNGCPYKRLNSAAIKLLHGIAKFEPIPKELEKNKWAIEIPISYSIVNI